MLQGRVGAGDLALLGLAAQLPPGFRACMKVWERITTRVFPDHARYGERAGKPNPDFLNADLFAEFVATPIAEGFADFIGPLVLEIPPSRAPVEVVEWETALVRFLEAVPPALQVAVAPGADGAQLTIASRGADGYISLREAILAANNTPGADFIGFDIATAAGKGNGSRNMQVRMEQHRGRLTISSTPGKGTLLHASGPLN